MASRDELLQALDRWLVPDNFQDYCPNGLQVEGATEITRIVSGVTASQALIDAAIEQGAQMVLVHHGYFWKGEDPTVRGMKHARLKALLEHDINLVAYHLPLDDHPDYGNNRQLAQVLGVQNPAPLDGLVWHGQLPKPMTADEFAEHLSVRLSRPPLHIGNGPERISHIGWCTGAAQGYIGKALDAGLDAFVSGEVSEPTTHVARECGIHYFAAGHHATERYGVQALGEALAKAFHIEHRFIDCDNPV
ncbi:Nif3-like dinuclear metal center hexameric protein [Marinobacter sp. SS21]|uniref:Nif3-like dinuclear metal center hexameric protein n=1 Tax=Marinobacter sp. SS21 TaxID=2979460 RepID=UPI00232AFA89|nr:Nif3-like dinuclear metal center hexameric protein [Marinobacter sp. SS21]MDC0661762.1 Nif3-like dinuclear metal center hexameric protein [Marinobacter sp. SS21]